jgi:TRAP-type transport system small permease protein
MDQPAVQTHTSSEPNKIMLGVSKVMAGAAATILVVMMMISVVEVCGRFFFNKPLNGSFELGGILLVTAGTWGMGLCQLKKNHIRVDVITNRFSRRVKAAFDIFAYIFCITASGAVTWRSSVMTFEHITDSVGALTPTLLIPWWPFMLTLAMGFGWLTIVFIYNFWQSCVEVSKR